MDKAAIDKFADGFRSLHAAGCIGERTTEQYYDPTAGRFLPDRYVEGTCPACGYTDARGDQCDNCGRTLDPTDLIDVRSKLSDGTPELRETSHWFILLPVLEAELGAWLATREGWRSARFPIGRVGCQDPPDSRPMSA